MPHRAAARYLGLRGMAMVLMGSYWALLGYGVMIAAPQPPPDLALIHAHIPRELRAAVWMATGLFAIWSAFAHRCYEHSLAGLIVMPAIRAVSYAGSWMIYVLHDLAAHLWTTSGRADDFPVAGLANGWYSSLVYWVMVGVVLIMTMIPEHYVPEFARPVAERPHKALRWVHRKVTRRTVDEE